MKKNKIRTIKKSLLCLIACFILSFLSLIVISATFPHAYAKDSLLATDNDYIAFVKENNIEIPEEFIDSPGLGDLIKDIIETIERTPDCIFPYSYRVTLDFAENIRNVFNEVKKSEQSKTMSTKESYTLQDSKLYLNSGWLNYNCYAYAINRDENPNEYETEKQYQPGDFSDEYFGLGLTISEMATVVKSDLQELGYSNVGIYNSISSLESRESLICIRKGNFDYHFMKYDVTSGNWFHKPGFTAILKYNYTPSNDRVWIAESIDLNGNASLLPSISYDSDIYYIKYTIPQTIEIFKNFGYQGTTFHWLGKEDMTVADANGVAVSYDATSTLVIDGNTSLSFNLETQSCYNLVSVINGTVSSQIKLNPTDTIVKIDGKNTQTSSVYVNIYNNAEINNASFSINTSALLPGSYTLTLTSYIERAFWTGTEVKTFDFKIKRSDLDECVTEGSLITLADGSQKPVEDLTGNEQLLVWNLWTGTFDTAPILFFDSDAESVYEVINLGFSDGKSVKVISEHAFWDFDLNKYVFLRRDAAQYIGHWFNKQTTDADGNMTWTRVQLASVDIQNEVTTAWSPVTYGHLCYYVNGMLSMPGATEGLINIFEVDPDTMKIDEEKYLADIAEYGLLSYEEVADIMSEDVFNAFNGKYLLVSIGKGLTTWEEIYSLLDRYATLF